MRRRIRLLGLFLLPVAYLVAATRWSDGLAGQPGLVLARTPEEFARQLRLAGGAESVREGIWLDMVFVGAVATVAWVVLRRRPRHLAVALAAVSLDTAENALAYVMAGREVGLGLTRTLAVLAALKFAAYIALLVVVVLVVRRPPRDELDSDAPA